MTPPDSPALFRPQAMAHHLQAAEDREPLRVGRAWKRAHLGWAAILVLLALLGLGLWPVEGAAGKAPLWRHLVRISR